MANFDAATIARLDRLYAAPQVVEQRQRLREVLNARPGERGLDIGCGAGHVIAMMETQFHPDSFGAGLLGPIRDAGRKDGISTEILHSWESELRARTEPGQWFFCLNRFVFIAERA